MTRRERLSIALPRISLFGAAFLALVALAGPVDAAHQAQPSVKQTSRFLWGLAGEESGWNYYARNVYSGAFGKYQIMPANWIVWSHQYLGDGWIDQSPANQEVVARAKIVDLYDWLGKWKRVAYWWLTGLTDTHRKHWSDVAQNYVHNVMSLMSRAPRKHLAHPPHSTGKHSVRAGDLRLSVQRLKMHRKPGIKGPVAHARAGSSLQILALRHGPRHNVLWFKARNAKGRTGWLMVKHTLPYGHD